MFYVKRKCLEKNIDIQCTHLTKEKNIQYGLKKIVDMIFKFIQLISGFGIVINSKNLYTNTIIYVLVYKARSFSSQGLGEDMIFKFIQLI